MRVRPPVWIAPTFVFLGVVVGLGLMLIPYSVDSTHSLDGTMSCGLPLLEVIRYYLAPTDCFRVALARVALGSIIGVVLVGLGVFAAYLRNQTRNGPSPTAGLRGRH
jgi:hypothetical protein